MENLSRIIENKSLSIIACHLVTRRLRWKRVQKLKDERFLTKQSQKYYIQRICIHRWTGIRRIRIDSIICLPRKYYSIRIISRTVHYSDIGHQVGPEPDY
jgi:hypothetical protein